MKSEEDYFALPRSQLTSEARAARIKRAAQMNRCRHGVNVVMKKCQQCEAEGVSAQPAGPNRDGA